MPLLFDIAFEQTTCQTGSATGFDFELVDMEDSIPKSFFQGLEDCKQGRVIDMEIALNEPPPDDL